MNVLGRSKQLLARRVMCDTRKLSMVTCVRARAKRPTHTRIRDGRTSVWRVQSALEMRPCRDNDRMYSPPTAKVLQFIVVREVPVGQ